MLQKIVMVMMLWLAAPAVWASDVLEGSLSVGDVAGDFTLPDAKKKQVTLSEELKKGAVVLSFYRGGWCPYCNRQLHAYQERLDEIEALGAQLIAVSPEVPSEVQLTIVKNEVQFTVLSDVGNVLAAKYGLLWQLPEEKKVGFTTWLKESSGKTLKEINGQDKTVFPVPATFVIGADGTVVYAFKEVDYKQRAEIDDIVAALKKVAK